MQFCLCEALRTPAVSCLIVRRYVKLPEPSSTNFWDIDVGT